MNESQVGVGVRGSGIPREQIFITSKIYHNDFGYARARECIQESVDQLGLGYYDLYLIHSPLTGKENRIATYRALVEAKKDGLIKKIGVSNYSGKHIDEIIDVGLELPDVDQIELHPFCQQRPIVEYCRAKGITVQAYSPLVTGRMDLDNLPRSTIRMRHKSSFDGLCKRDTSPFRNLPAQNASNLTPKSSTSSWMTMTWMHLMHSIKVEKVR